MLFQSNGSCVQLHILLALVLVFFSKPANSDKKKVVLQLPKKPNVGGKQIHHHHHYLLMDPVAGGTKLGPFDRVLPRPSPSQQVPNMRYLHSDIMNNIRFPHHVPVYLGQSPDAHKAFIDHPYREINHLRNIESMMFPAVPPPPPPSPTPTKLKIIKKSPMKMEGTSNDDYFDTSLFQPFSDEQPVVIHKSYSDFVPHSSYSLPSSYNPSYNSYSSKPQNVVQHIYTEEVQTDYK